MGFYFFKLTHVPIYSMQCKHKVLKSHKAGWYPMVAFASTLCTTLLTFHSWQNSSPSRRAVPSPSTTITPAYQIQSHFINRKVLSLVRVNLVAMMRLYRWWCWLGGQRRLGLLKSARPAKDHQQEWKMPPKED